jgi:hypothetical protein
MKKRRIFVLILILGSLLLQNVPILAQKTKVQVDGQKIFDIIEYMASDQFLGRKPNTPEFFKLQEWVVNQYKVWGLEPAGENGTFFQSVPISRTYAVNYGTPKMVINGREFFARFGDFSIDHRSMTGKTLKGDIVFAGYGISAPKKEFDEYTDLDVRGKIVFVFKGNPNDYKPPRGRFFRQAEEDTVVAEKWVKESQDDTKIMTAYEKGAAGIIIFNPVQETTRFRRSRAELRESPFERDFIVVSQVSERVFQWIFWIDMQISSGGFTNWANNLHRDIKKKKVRSFVTNAQAEIKGYEKTLLKGKKFEDDKGRNIIAKITGTDPELKNEFVVMGAHFDHLGVTNGQIYNGADDNASGSAVVMELARLMKEHKIKTRRTVIFCLWTAEELGLVGSRYWVENPADGVTMDQVATYFNMDMVGLGNEIRAPGALNFPSIWEVIQKDQDPEILESVQASEGGPGGSDHSAFIELGIESLALMTRGDAGHPDYHDTGDDSEKINPKILEKTGQFVLQGTINLANEIREKLLIPDRKNIYDAMRWSIAVINPDLNVRGGWTLLEASTEAELSGLLINKIKELKQPQEDTGPMRYFRRFRPRGNYATGIYAKAFKYNIYLMQTAKELLDFGRIDVLGDDGVWFKEGLTEQGALVLTAIQDSGIVLHFINPSKETLKDVLEKGTKPFVVSGFSQYDDQLFTQINDKNILIGVDFNPEDVDGCVKQLEMFRQKLGDTDNILLYVTSKEGLDEAKKELYFKLVEKGWEKKEIYAIGGAGTTRRSRGNLDKLAGPRSQMPFGR